MIENRNDDEVTVMTTTSNGSGDNDPIIEDTTENKNANNASGMDIVNNEKELEITRKDKEATENDSNKAETTSFRIISVINTVSTEGGKKDTELKDDITEATDSFLDRSLLKTALNAVGISDNDLYVTILKKDYPKVGVILVFAQFNRSYSRSYPSSWEVGE